MMSTHINCKHQRSVLLLVLLLLIACQTHSTHAEISNQKRHNYADTIISPSTASSTNGVTEPTQYVDAGGGATQRLCHTTANFNAIAQSIDDMEDLELDVPINIAFGYRQKKRFSLYLNSSTPLTITFSQNVARKIYYNQTINLSRSMKSEPNALVIPCALHGQYDLFVQARHGGSIKVEAHAEHPQANWLPLNFTNSGHIRNQNRVRRRQMIVKWGKSKFDFHAVHYCLVLSTQQPHRLFCPAVAEYAKTMRRRWPMCTSGNVMDLLWMRPLERMSKIEPHGTNIICTGSRTKHLLRGLTSNKTYYIDIFGIHTKRQNFTFHIASKAVKFSRSHPRSLKSNIYSEKKISGPHGPQVFSFKVPQQPGLSNGNLLFLRYLVLPCDGSEVNATILRKRSLVASIGNIYRPTYIRLPVKEGERYIARFTPSNKDEVLRASKVGLALTVTHHFSHLPELPENITVFEVSSECSSVTIAWFKSPELRTMRYCIIVFNLPQRNRSSIDSTNYCMDFGKSIMTNTQFHSIKCNERTKSSLPVETHTIFNLNPGESYLIYVTAKLSNGKALPYQSLQVTLSPRCYRELYESSELNSYE